MGKVTKEDDSRANQKTDDEFNRKLSGQRAETFVSTLKQK